MFEKLIRISVGNSVFSNLLMVGILVMGAFSYSQIRLSLYPQVNMPWIHATAKYPGAQAEVVERDLTNIIEEAIAELDYHDLLLSQTVNDHSHVMFRLNYETEDIDKAFRDLRRKITKLKLPEGAEEIEVEKTNYAKIPIITLGIYGLDERELVDVAEMTEKAISILAGVNQVQIEGQGEEELRIQVDPNRLNSLGYTMNDLATSIRLANIDIPIGEIQTGREEVSLRLMGKFESIKEIEELRVVKSLALNPRAESIRLGDVAKVSREIRKGDFITSINGEPGIVLSITKSEGTDTIKVVNQIKERFSTLKNAFPEGAKMIFFNDTSKDIHKLLGILEGSCVVGLTLLVLTMWFFFGWRQALFAFLGIPVTFALTLSVMFFAGYSINQISLFAMVLVLGMVVDDAIIVIENVYRKLEMGLPPKEAAIQGISEVAVPVFSSTLTTVVAFLPIVFMGGPLGRLMVFIPIVVCISLAASLLECFLILPSHLAEGGKLTKKSKRKKRWVVKKITSLQISFLRNSKMVIFVMVTLALISMAYMGMRGRELFSNEDLRSFRVGVSVKTGSRKEETDRVLKHCVELLQDKCGKELHSIVTYSGIFRSDIWGSEYRDGSQGQILVELKDESDKSLDELIESFKEVLSNVPEVIKSEYAKMTNSPVAEAGLTIYVRGEDIPRIRGAANVVKEHLASIPGVFEIQDSYKEGKKQIHIEVDEVKAARLGVSKAFIGRELFRYYEGEKMGTFEGEKRDMDIILTCKNESENKIEELENRSFVTPKGQSIKLKDVATLSLKVNMAMIAHYNGMRDIQVTASLDPSVTNADLISQRLNDYFPKLEASMPGIFFKHGGLYDDLERSFKELVWAMVFSFFLVYFVLGTQFKSLTQPFLIMASAPLCLIGVAFSMMIGNNPLSIFILIGIVGLLGVVVNDSLILIDYMNRLRGKNRNLAYAILRGASERVRPIFFTTVTTIAGLLPAALGLTGKSLIWQPLAQTFIWGLIVASFGTIFVLPILYAFIAKRTSSH